MSLKKPIVRIVLVLFLVLAGVGYFIVSNYLFDPFESDYPADVSTLVPRDVDFFVAKARLSADFDPFPRLAVAERVQETGAWRSFERYDYAALDEQYGFSAPLAQLQQLPDQMGGIDLLKVFGGRDFALAGYFHGPDLAQADWAAYGRVSWMGKVGISMLAFPGLIGLEEQGLSVAVEDDHVALSGGQLMREVFVARVNDVGVVGTSLELVRKAMDLEARGGQDSFGQGATYFDNIDQAPRGARRDEVEVYFDWLAWREKSGGSGRWPDPDSQDFLPAFLARLFQLGSLKSTTGVVGFDTGATVHLRGELSSELMTTEQKRIYRQRGVERDWFLQRAARMAKADSSLFVYLEMDLGDLLRLAFEAAEPALRDNVEDVVRGSGKYNGLDALIEEISQTFKDRIALVIREDDYEKKPDEDPPNNGEPAAAIAVVLWTRSELAQQWIDSFHQVVVQNQGRLGLRGRNGEKGVYRHNVTSGHVIWEFWHPLIDGTGHMSSVIDADFYILSNNFRMIGEMIKVFREGGTRYPRLSERIDFREMVEEGLPQANAILWLNPRELSKVMRPLHERDALYQVTSSIDWELERAREEQKVIAEQFPGKVRGRLDQDTQDKVDLIVQPRLETLKHKLIAEQVPALRARLERNSKYAELVSGLLVMLALDPKHFDLSVSAAVPLDE